MYASPEALSPISFRDSMADAQDAALHRSGLSSRPTVKVVSSRAPLRVWYSVDLVADLLRVSPARVRLLCGQGRIVGAKRKRGTRPWRIPAHLIEGTRDRYRVIVTPGKRGPVATFEVTVWTGTGDDIPL